MPPDPVYVEASLAEVERTVVFLKAFEGLSEDEFVSDLRNCYSACYALMTAIEGTANVAAHLLTTSSKPPPRSLADGFRSLAGLGVLRDPDLVERMMLMSRFRNLLVHRYWQVDYGRVYRILTESLGDFGKFASEVLAYLDRSKPS